MLVKAVLTLASLAISLFLWHRTITASRRASKTPEEYDLEHEQMTRAIEACLARRNGPTSDVEALASMAPAARRESPSR